MVIRTVCAGWFACAEELEFLGVQGVKWLLGGARGVLWRGYARWILGCHWMLWAEWLDLDDKLGAGKGSLTFTVLNLRSLVPCLPSH
jgi:hypothetical protein